MGIAWGCGGMRAREADVEVGVRVADAVDGGGGVPVAHGAVAHGLNAPVLRLVVLVEWRRHNPRPLPAGG